MADARRANAAALAAILLAGALSTAWAFLVPIFQAPDEPAHFDYAISIYNAHRLVRVSDGRPDWIVSPYTKYLMRATDFERVAWHSSMRAPAGYGSRAYFAGIDAGAPGVRAATPSSGTVNYITPYYPFGFYGLEAAWMRIVSWFTGSLVTIFFAARLLCVALTMLGLYFNYRTALNLGIPRWTSVALVAAIGFFPLTTWISSYVQPDNLAYALVSAALFFATQLRPGTLPWRTVAALGISLGLLAVTKYQFFLSAALPIAFLVGVRVTQAKSVTTASRLAVLAAVAAPTLALLGVQYWFVNRAIGGGATVSHTDMNAGSLAAVFAQGVGPTLSYVAAGIVGGYTGCFITGSCAASFWQMIGWVDTPIVIGSASIELALRAAIAFATIGVSIVLVLYLGRNAIRTAAAAMRGHVRRAIAAVVADPVLNSYVCFVALMLAMYVVTNNAFGIEGRQWYPYVFPAFLCFVWYAPKALRRERRALSAGLACALLAYSLVASAYASTALKARYYGPQVARYVTTDPAPSAMKRQDDGVLWPVVSREYHVSSRDFRFAFERGSRLLIDGTALLPGSAAVPSTVAVVLDRHDPIPVLTNQFLYPVAEITHNLADGYSGFYANIDTAHLREGPHTVAAYAKVPGDGRYDRIQPDRIFFVTAADGKLPGDVLGELSRAATLRGSLMRSGTCNNNVALYAGRLAAGSTPSRYHAAWLLVDGRPYPARYSPAGGSFAGTVPTAGLAAGLHDVIAYVVRDGARSEAISQAARLRIEPGPRHAQFLKNPPAACADPLGQLAKV